MDYNDELIGIIDEIHTNADTKATHDNIRSSLSSSSTPSSVAATVDNLIDFDNCQYEHVQSTESTSSSAIMAYEEISKQNVTFFPHYFSDIFITCEFESILIYF